MIITLVLFAFACLLPVVFFQLTRGSFLAQRSPAELANQMRPVDIEAFSNLIDPDEEQFLRSSLPPSLFRSVRRERLIAATEYVGAVSHNAAVLVRIGESARHHADPGTVQAGHELANSGVRLRLHCSLVLFRLWTAIVVPGARLSSVPLVERYQQASALARQLNRLRGSNPSLDASVTS